MDRAIALEKLGLAGEDWGPCAAGSHSHEEFAKAWRGKVPCPTEAALANAFAQVTPAKEPSAVDMLTPDDIQKLKAALGL